MSMYPPDWPKCACGEPVLDGHLTCGDVRCSEREVRAKADRARILAEAADRAQGYPALTKDLSEHPLIRDAAVQAERKPRIVAVLVPSSHDEAIERAILAKMTPAEDFKIFDGLGGTVGEEALAACADRELGAIAKADPKSLADPSQSPADLAAAWKRLTTHLGNAVADFGEADIDLDGLPVEERTCVGMPNREDLVAAEPVAAPPCDAGCANLATGTCGRCDQNFCDNCKSDHPCKGAL